MVPEIFDYIESTKERQRKQKRAGQLFLHIANNERLVTGKRKTNIKQIQNIATCSSVSARFFPSRCLTGIRTSTEYSVYYVTIPKKYIYIYMLQKMTVQGNKS